jgi:hypothetical protein
VTPTEEAERVAAGTVGSVIILHTIGLSGTELGRRSAEARVALAWLGLQDAAIIHGICDLIHAAKDVEARQCTHLGAAI